MSDTLANLRRKIGGAEDLRSVVRTMKAVPASSIGQYENSVRALADYYRSVSLGQFDDLVAEFALKTLAELPGKSRTWTVGERVHARLVDSGLPALALFELPASVKGISPLIGQIPVEREKQRGHK